MTSYPAPIKPTHTRIGWIGTGIMGGAIASRLLSAGYSVTVYARNPSKVVCLKSQGAHLADSPADVARNTDVIFTMLGHPSDVRQIVLEGLLSSVNPNSVIIDHTSSHPVLAKQIFEAAREKNCWTVDAPVSGADIGAREGKLAIFAGGNEDVVKWLKPLFDVLGKATFVGGPGKGQSCKIANQIVAGGSLLGLSEGLVFVEKAGLDNRKFVEAVKGVKGGAAGSMIMELFGERMIERDFRPGGFTEYIVKDLGMGFDVGAEEGDNIVPLPGAALSKQLFSAMVANGDGKLGIQGLITVIERIRQVRS
ncbi:PREDICTED: probable 3-hydroxyisobutyrate dehydrogenase-like 2, mitochondrial [Nicotiana attenuata]|uniref:3-hydroxyisobutyrate dehydrogenase-like 3, mitochondrial n=1 Tax=Nicotiana attenuata TaxID=49451 RepID=A0A314LBH2_NICAT|nr:PREDICTED: probable 3-hydroxyisobutyrate dehydrogenase-like 2, mitochondrial [Nicotiana attenuata]OIT38124.1 putative 3-hydroxyisobutyrate dehydrogenase-like 3, mitochondrial [Nicotiana attenuata]